MFRSQPRALRDLGGERVPTSSQLCGTLQLLNRGYKPVGGCESFIITLL